MSPTQITGEVKSRLAQATDHLKQEIGKIRTGRAHPGMLDGLSVEVYGQQMPLKAVGNIIAPEPQLLQITPFDPTNLRAIAEAVRNDASLGLNPADDGRVVRIQIPPLTTETRTSMVKIVGQKVEDSLITARSARHDAFRKLEAAEKAKEIGKDERARLEKEIDELLARQKTEVEELAKSKEQEIMTV